MKVTILTTGGTIASRSAGGMARGNEVVSAVTGLETLAEVTQEEFCVVASSQMTPRMMFDLSCRVAELLEGEADGVVVTHGTDTMEETAYMLDMVVPGIKPVVITGAMRTSEQLGADGPRNVFASAAVAASSDAKSRPAMLVLNDEIHSARWVQKVHSSNPRAFDSPGHGRIGEVHGARPVFYEAPRARRPVGAVGRDGADCEGGRDGRDGAERGVGRDGRDGAERGVGRDGRDGAERVVGRAAGSGLVSGAVRKQIASRDPDALVTDVDLISLYAGADDRLIRACLDSGARGIVVEFMGKGNAPRAILPGLEACRRAGVPVVVVTRCQSGQVEIERYERELGCINGGEISGYKARLRLMLALGAAGAEAGVEKVRPYFCG